MQSYELCNIVIYVEIFMKLLNSVIYSNNTNILYLSQHFQYLNFTFII